MRSTTERTIALLGDGPLSAAENCDWAARALHVDQQRLCGPAGGVCAQVLLDQGEGQVDAGGDTGR